MPHIDSLLVSLPVLLAGGEFFSPSTDKHWVFAIEKISRYEERRAKPAPAAVVPGTRETFFIRPTRKTVSPAALRNRGGSYNKLIIRQFSGADKNALEHKNLMFRRDSG